MACAISIRSKGSLMGPGRAPDRWPCSTVTARGRKSSRAIQPAISAATSYYLDALDHQGRRWRELYALREVPCESFAEVRREQEAADRRLIAFCDQLADERLDEIVILNRPGDKRYPERIQDVLAHLFQHGIHHRGQVHAMLAATTVAPPQLDEFFLAQDADLCAEDLRTLGLTER